MSSGMRIYFRVTATNATIGNCGGYSIAASTQ